MNSFKNRLKQIMSERNISQSELSRRTGIGRNSISDYLKGKYEAKQDKVFELAKALNVNEAWLMGFDISKDRIINDNDITTVYNQLTPPRQHNVLDFANKQLEEQNNEVSENDRNIITIKRMHAAAAGVVGEELFDDLIEEDVEFYEDEVPKGADFCILVNGDSMEPMIKEGTYAFIKRETNIKDGTIALVVLDGTSFIKRVDIHPEYLKLISLNPKYEDITVSSFNDLKVIGKVVL
ncbi:LexA family transcriptional regulator [Staphylococcus simulans]|uniref:LexA family transcriptional regulator n=1 Tax=Staphylococcus simulans TaxID=1286 RepID=UPI0021D3F85B|nr:LexA family transcriptional regulator [Staphylococcus simulans]UXR32357.1 LexA family transcriptional regulator [Staphylococcus simulans]